MMGSDHTTSVIDKQSQLDVWGLQKLQKLGRIFWVFLSVDFYGGLCELRTNEEISHWCWKGIKLYSKEFMFISSSKMFSNLQWAKILPSHQRTLSKLQPSWVHFVMASTRAHSVMVLLHSLPPPPLQGPQIFGLREVTQLHSVVAKVKEVSVSIMWSNIECCWCISSTPKLR